MTLRREHEKSYNQQQLAGYNGISLGVIRLMVNDLFEDVGVLLHLARAIIRDLKVSYDDASEMLQEALDDLPTGDFSLEDLAEAAASFKFVIDYCKMVDDDTIPRAMLPGDQLIKLLLLVFREKLRTEEV